MITYTLNSERERRLARAMIDLMPDGTVVTFYIPPTEAIAKAPPADYSMEPEPWEVAA